VTDTDSVLLEIAEGIATLTLNRPDAGNAINLAVAAALEAHAATLENSGARVLVLRSTGRQFCVGGDVRQMANTGDRPTFLAELAGSLHRAVIALRELPIPIVAAVQGSTAGAGVGLVLLADIAVASDKATFVSAYSAIGLSPERGVTALLPAAIGSRRAALFTLTNAPLTATEAVEWGLVSEVTTAEALAARVDELARVVASRPGASAGETARLIRLASERSYVEQLNDETASIARLSGSDAAAALISAFGNR
jgi:2-(1,2-epoxy-1,2-dihydrophenyl)acetyl-CoA isomerase